MHYFLVFYDDQGNREDCSVFYSQLVKAKTTNEAINKASKWFSLPEDEDPKDRLGARLVTLIE